MGMGLGRKAAAAFSIAALALMLNSHSFAWSSKQTKKKSASTAESKANQAAAPKGQKHKTHASSSRKAKKSKKSKRGQQAIDSTRAREIQEALIEQHYMDGEPSGNWDDTTQTALRKYQADNGWQSKTVPDSRALIKLGLGPSKEGLLNPETAMTSPMDHPKTSEPSSEKSEPRE